MLHRGGDRVGAGLGGVQQASDGDREGLGAVEREDDPLGRAYGDPLWPTRWTRRARSAALSMVPTTTGAAKAVSLVLPELSGKLNGLAVRVPTPNVSMVDFVATLEKTDITISEVNAALKKASEESLAGILGYSDAPLVSIDFNGSSLSSVVDAPTTHVIGNMVKVLAWYDNEAGYSHRMVDLAVMIGSQLKT